MEAQDRAEALQTLLETSLDFMEQSFLEDGSDMSVMGTQIFRMLLASGAAFGFFKDPDLSGVYRNSLLTPSQKVFSLVKVFAAKLLADAEFHEKHGAEVDARLHELYLALAEKLSPFKEAATP